MFWRRGLPCGRDPHDPIALVDEGTPIVVVTPRHLAQAPNNVQKVWARGTETTALVTDGDESVAAYANHVIWFPDTKSLCTPDAADAPLQPRCRPAAQLGQTRLRRVTVPLRGGRTTSSVEANLAGPNADLGCIRDDSLVAQAHSRERCWTPERVTSSPGEWSVKPIMPSRWSGGAGGVAVLALIAAPTVAYQSTLDRALLVLAAAGLVVIVVLRWPPIALYLSIFLVSATMPAGARIALNFDVLSVQFFEPLLWYVTIWLGLTKQWAPRTLTQIGPMLAAVLVSLAVAAAYGHFGYRSLVEGFALVDYCAAYIVAASLLHRRKQADSLLPGCSRALLFSLWFSALLLVASAAFGFDVKGAVTEVGLAGQYVEATRFQTNTGFVALAVAGLLLAAAFVREAQGQLWLAAWLPPCVLILFLSFSRNHVVALFVVYVASLLLVRTARDVAYFAKRSIRAVALVLLLGGTLAAFAPLLPGRDFLGAQIEGYQLRVLGGLTRSARELDPSLRDRALEDSEMKAAILAAPVLGHGLGHAYRRPTGVQNVFTAQISPYYGHNFYYWWWVKGGLVGLLAFAWSARAGLAGYLAVVRAATLARLLMPVSLALLVVSLVAPLGETPNSAVVLGVVLGAMAAAAVDKSPSPTKRGPSTRLARRVSASSSDDAARGTTARV